VSAIELSDFGISIEVFDGSGKRLNEASKYIMPATMEQVIAIAISEAHRHEKSKEVCVSIDLGEMGGGWKEIWSTKYDHINDMWTWE
jgi:hypothetical protein